MPSKSNRPALPGLPPVRTASADTRDMLEMIRGLSLSDRRGQPQQRRVTGPFGAVVAVATY